VRAKQNIDARTEDRKINRGRRANPIKIIFAIAQDETPWVLLFRALKIMQAPAKFLRIICWHT
jgi:hypothetical protein